MSDHAPPPDPPGSWTDGKRLVIGFSTLAAVFLLAAVGVLLTSCSRQDNTETPTATSANSQTQPFVPETSPTPSPSLSVQGGSKDEQQAYQQALTAVKKYEAGLAAVSSHPSIENVSALKRAAVDPWLKSLQDNIYKKLDSDVRGKIQREVTRAELVEVKLNPQSKIWVSSRTEDWKPHNYRLAFPSPVVVIDTCVTTTVVKPLTKNGKQIVKDSKPGNQNFYEGRLTLTQPPYLKGNWAVTWSDAEQVESC